MAANKLFTVPFANGGDKTPAIPDAQQGDGSVSYTTGYGPDYELQLGVDPNAKNIGRGSYNSLFYEITTALREMQSGVGAQPFNASFASSLPGGGYAVGAIIPQSSGLGVWVNLTANNTTNPDTGGAGWVAISARVDYAVGAGTANAQTATYTPALPTTDGTIAKFKAVATNTGPMTFNGLAVLGGAGQALQGGEVTANGLVTLCRLGSNWIIISSVGAYQVATATASQQAATLAQAQALSGPIQSIAASVGAGALTLTWNTQTLNFRSPTATVGTPVIATPSSSTLQIVVPSGATLGSTSGQQVKVVLLVAYNSGTPVLCVANINGGFDWSETNLISPTTISSGATSATTIYSASAVSANSPYRILGVVTLTEATAGTWATAHSAIQGVGGQAFNSMQSIGFCQAYVDVLTNRAYTVTYFNTTNAPILVLASGNPATANTGFRAYVNGLQVTAASTASGQTANVAFIVPVGASYRIDNGSTITSATWIELR